MFWGMGAVVCAGRLQTVCVGKKAAAACVHTPSLAFQHPSAKEEGHSGKATLGVTVTQPKDDDTLRSVLVPDASLRKINIQTTFPCRLISAPLG